MNIEVGKLYRTRDGLKARIYATDGRAGDEIHGAKLYGGGWYATCWHRDGQWVNGVSNPSDIISEWIEKPEVDWSKMPAWANYVYQRGNGSWAWSGQKPYLAHLFPGYEWFIHGQASPCSVQEVGSVPDQFRPKFTGDWKDSLVERPK